MMPEAMKMKVFNNEVDYSSPSLSFKFPAFLEVVRHPKKRGYRFRYQSEGKTHGMLPGEPSSDEKEKVFPTIKLRGFSGRAKVVVTLVQDQEPRYIHPHTLLIDKEAVPGYHSFEITAGHDVELKNLAIQHINKSDLEDRLIDRELQSDFVHEVAINSFIQYRQTAVHIDHEAYIDCLADKDKHVDYYDHKTKIKLSKEKLAAVQETVKKRQKQINMSACRLCFTTFLQDPNTGKYCQLIEPVYSDVIIDGKKKEGAPLKIIRLSHVAGSVEGGKEIWLLSDKVDAEDMEVHFWEKPKTKGIMPWEGFGEFSKTDVYKQSLIVFRTPAYEDQNIDQPRTVNLQLRRKKDHNCVSDVHNFSFKPKHYDRYGLREKRRKVLPPEIYSAPPAKRQVLENTGEENDTNSISRWQPYPVQPSADGPTISDLLRGNFLTPNGTEATAIPSFPTFGASSFGGSLSQFVERERRSEDSDANSRDET